MRVDHYVQHAWVRRETGEGLAVYGKPNSEDGMGIANLRRSSGDALENVP